VLRALGRVSATNVAYALLLLVFVALGMFVYALATGGALAGIIAASMAVLMVASVLGFRVGARRRTASNHSGIAIPGENIWAQPLRREQIDRYMQSYRGVRDNHDELLQAVAVPGSEPTRLMDRRAA
jgi:hypothetical protein